MENKKSRYTEAQAKSFKKYISGKARIELVTTPSFKEYVTETAKAYGMSTNAYILKAAEEKAGNVSDELPPDVISNLMEWLKNHNHTSEEIADCLKSLDNK